MNTHLQLLKQKHSFTFNDDRRGQNVVSARPTGYTKRKLGECLAW